MGKRIITRRGVLGGLGASFGVGLATQALALEAGSSVIPRLRSGPSSTRGVASVENLIAKANLGGKVSYAVADATTGALLETLSHLVAMPPASVTKALTAHYALTHLGPGYRYKTRLLANGPVTNGQIEGDLILEASGDPVLSTDDLGGMAEALVAAGIKGVSGRFLVSLPRFAQAQQIDDSQPYQVSYNPGIAGLNLNRNRVHFEWKRQGSGRTVTMEARGARYKASSRTSTMEIVDRPGPVYEFTLSGGIDRWSVAKSALGSKGARWLPVRAPVDYALDALAQILKAREINLPPPVRVSGHQQGITLFETVSRQCPTFCATC